MTDPADIPPSRERPISAPVPIGPYLSTVFVLLFLAASFFYFGYFLVSLIFLLFLIPTTLLLELTDRVAFDGRRIYRTGLVPRLFSRLIRKRTRLKPGDIEQIETNAHRSLKRGGRYIYRYTTTIHGRDLTFVVSSGAGYRKFMRSLVPLLANDVLDVRSVEICEFLPKSESVRSIASGSGIPGADVLEPAIALLGHEKLKGVSECFDESRDEEGAEKLRTVANQLRLAGRLIQSVEAFRRALRLKPGDPQILFEFGRCLHSLAGARGDKTLDRRASALMRLSERRAGDDRELLIRLGESYFQFGDWRRAKRVFERITTDLGGSFRALRGLAEVSMRSGKIAHVIHNFDAAQDWAAAPPLRRWLEKEVEYFSRLNNDEEYLEIEVSRLNLVETLERTSRTSLRIFLAGLVVLLAGLVAFGPTVANVGWAISAIALAIRVFAKVFGRFLSARIPPAMVGEE